MTESGLPLELYGTPIGRLDSTNGAALLHWSKEAADRWGLNSTILSRSLPMGHATSELTESFFGGLLPEGTHLDRLAAEAKVSTTDLVGLLALVGADLAGALQIGPRQSAAEPTLLEASEVAVLVKSARGFLVGGGGSALPGLQRKVTLTRLDGRWLRGNGTLPSTHILKPVDAANRALIEGELFALAVAREIGLASFESWIEEFDDTPALVIERYDRRRVGSTIERIHQEDTAQALGLPWGGDAKFENNDRRASLVAVAGLLDARRTVFDRTPPETERLLRYTVLNVAIGNTDAHAKNFSLLHHADGRTELAPYYDSAPLALAYDSTTAMAMRVNGRFPQPDISRHDLVAEAVSWGLSEDRADGIVGETLERVIRASRTLEAHPSIEAHVPGYLRMQAENLLAGRPARIVSVVPLMALPRLPHPSL